MPAFDSDLDERARLQALASFGLLDTPPDPVFDDLVAFAARLCEAPMAIFTLVDGHRQWFKAVVGLDLRQTAREIAFCARTIGEPDRLEIEDAALDPRFADNPLVTGPPHLRFYSGVPLRVEGGHAVGSLAVLDCRPRRLTPQQRLDLEALGRQAVTLLEERRLRRQAQAASDQLKRQSGRLLAIAGRVAMLGAWELDLDRGSVVWSDVVAQIHGVPVGFSPGLEEALGYYLEPDRGKLAQAVALCSATGEPFDFEMRLQPANGRGARWVRSIGEAVRGVDGRITHLRGACQDITERKSQQVRIQHLADRLLATLESIPDPFFVVGHDWRIQLANGAFHALVGRTPAETVDQPLAALMADGAFLRCCSEATATPKEIEFTDAGTERRFSIRAFRLDDGWTILAQDVTRQAATLAQLRLLDTCVRRLNDAIVITDAQAEPPGPTIVFVNDAMCRLSDWAPQALVGHSPRRLQGAETQPDRLAAIRKAVSDCVPFETELINYRRGGERYWVELKLSPIHDDSGRCTHFVAVERDVTERKNAEIERAALEAQLRQAQKMESIGTLAGGIAHDFNNILGAVLGHVVVAKDALAAGEDPLPSIETIGASAVRARALVHQILTFGRQQTTLRVPQALKPLVDDAVSLLRATLPAAQVQLETRAGDGALYADVDGIQIQQILLNLCTNAWHALPATGGRIVVGLDDAGPPPAVAGVRSPCVHIWVEDDGCGIAEEARSRIFEPFFTTRPPGHGTGLGLSVAHGIAVAHGGAIAVDSLVGRGSTFHVYLPACPARAPRPIADAVARPEPHQLPGLRVLCVDDDPVMLITTQALLERLGCKVETRSDGQEALEHFRSGAVPFDLVVTDYNMPGMNGLALAEALHRCTPEVPVILASGFITEPLCAQAAAIGVRAIVQKERTVEDLAGAVLKVARQRPLG